MSLFQYKPRYTYICNLLSFLMQGERCLIGNKMGQVPADDEIGSKMWPQI